MSCTRPTSEGICFAKQSEQWLTKTTAQSGEASESVPRVSDLYCIKLYLLIFYIPFLYKITLRTLVFTIVRRMLGIEVCSVDFPLLWRNSGGRTGSVYLILLDYAVLSLLLFYSSGFFRTGLYFHVLGLNLGTLSLASPD